LDPVNQRSGDVIQRSSTFPCTVMFVFLQEKWQNRIVPVENGATSVADACRVLPDIVV
jgi:hypothetical protein